MKVASGAPWGLGQVARPVAGRRRRLVGLLLVGLLLPVTAGSSATGERGASDSSSAPAGASASREPADGLWISRSVLAALPTRGPAWEALLDHAGRSIDRPDLSDQDDPTNVRVLARALVAARLGDARRRREVARALERVRGSERGAGMLAVAREPLAYVIAADLIGLEGEARREFEAWLRGLRARRFGERTLHSTHEDRPNNWGTHAGASRIAIALYLGDRAELERAAHVFRGWTGEPGGWRGFSFGEAWWQAGFFRRHAVNPVGARWRGHSLDGVLPDDQRRGGRFRWPPPKENYVYEALQGAAVQAALLARAGHPAWQWGDRALLRAFRWLHEQADYPAEGDDTWLPHLVNHAYGSDFPAPIPSSPGKAMGFTDWTHPPTPERGEVPAPRAD